jgi:hypothetical protein
MTTNAQRGAVPAGLLDPDLTGRPSTILTCWWPVSSATAKRRPGRWQPGLAVLRISAREDLVIARQVAGLQLPN